ncbi:MAG: DoxX family protein [Salinibacterium sp.]|nr:DoxX family protein [Salinibacterium sp.]
MTIAVWIVSGLVAALYLMAGAQKAFLPTEKLTKQFPWVETTTVPGARVVGVLEILGAVGLILPVLTGTLPILTPIAAVGLVALQVGAIIVHVRRGEIKMLGMNSVLLLLAAFVAVLRFLGY